MKTDAPPGIAGWPPPVLDPAGPFAGPIQTVAWVLFIMAAVVMVMVAVALGIALFGPRKWKRRTAPALSTSTNHEGRHRTRRSSPTTLPPVSRSTKAVIRATAASS